VVAQTYEICSASLLFAPANVNLVVASCVFDAHSNFHKVGKGVGGVERRWVVVEQGQTSIVSKHASREAAARAARTLTEVSRVEHRAIEKRAPRFVAPWTCQGQSNAFSAKA
jgi:hypothetical protein